MIMEKTLKTICSLLLLICIAGIQASPSGSKTRDSAPTEDGEVDMDEIKKVIEELAKKPYSEESNNFPEKVLDELPIPPVTNVTDESIGDRAKRSLYYNPYNPYNPYSHSYPSYFICPLSYTISSISSYHSYYHADRQFSISCKPSFSYNTWCFESDWLNSFGNTFSYTCPSNYVMSGIVTYNSYYHHDDRFSVRCCSSYSHYHSNCHWTPYVNYYDEYFSWYVPSHNYVAGISAVRNSYYEDRRFRFLYCANY